MPILCVVLVAAGLAVAWTQVLRPPPPPQRWGEVRRLNNQHRWADEDQPNAGINPRRTL